MNEKKICPLLAIAAGNVSGRPSPALCIGTRCAFCTRTHVYGAEYVESCAIKDIADSLDTIAGNG